MTSSPLSSSRLESEDPINPADPVTNIFTELDPVVLVKQIVRVKAIAPAEPIILAKPTAKPIRTAYWVSPAIPALPAAA